MTITDEIRRHAAPLAEAAGLDLLDVQVKGSGPRTLVRVVVDRPGGVELAQCQQLSGALSRELDDHDPIDGRYALEVTSPGTDWPLRTQRDFERVSGRTVRVMRRAGEREQEVAGKVVAAEADAVVVQGEAGEVRVPYADIAWAKQALPW